jgi:hypothetical protein
MRWRTSWWQRGEDGLLMLFGTVLQILGVEANGYHPVSSWAYPSTNPRIPLIALTALGVLLIVLEATLRRLNTEG